MNRPDKLNALNTALTQALLDALAAADADEGVRAVVLTGDGRGFCAGADLAEFKDLTPDKQDAVLRACRADLPHECSYSRCPSRWSPPCGRGSVAAPGWRSAAT